MSRESEPGIGYEQEGSAQPFYPGQDQMGFGMLTTIAEQDQAVFSVPKLPITTSPIATTLELPLHLDVSRERKLPTVTKTVRIEDINVLVQARDEYDGIGVLADAIKSAGVLLHTPFVAQFDEEGARRYLDFVYGIYGDKVPERKRYDDLITTRGEEGNEVVLLAVSGHRRLRALKQLGEEAVDAKIAAGIDPLHALYLQAQENTPKPLKDYERAEQHGRLFAVSRVKDPGISPKGFATIVGQKPEVIVRDLYYYLLPEEVKKYVVPRQKYINADGETVIPDQALMTFNVACQLGRLVERGVPKHDILFLARRFFEENITSEKEARRRVNLYLAEYRLDIGNGGNTNMVDLFGYRQDRLQKMRRRRGVASRFERPVDDALSYFRRVLTSRSLGLEGIQEEDALSITGAATRLKSLAEVASELLPLLRGVLTPEKMNEMRGIFEELKKESEVLSDVSGESSENSSESSVA